jgi:hypothetical protein
MELFSLESLGPIQMNQTYQANVFSLNQQLNQSAHWNIRPDNWSKYQCLEATYDFQGVSTETIGKNPGPFLRFFDAIVSRETHRLKKDDPSHVRRSAQLRVNL